MSKNVDSVESSLEAGSDEACGAKKAPLATQSYDWVDTWIGIATSKYRTSYSFKVLVRYWIILLLMMIFLFVGVPQPI